MTYSRVEHLAEGVTLYQGDMMDVLPTLGRFDACVTDPPYGIGLAGGFSGAGGFSAPIKRRQYDGDWDNETPSADSFAKMVSRSDLSIVWGGNYFTDKLPQGSFWLVWDKQNSMPTFSDCELAWTNIDRKSVKRFIYLQSGCMSREKERFHPTQKPIEVMVWCIDQLPKTVSTILDPFMGSGTTGVAAVKRGKCFTGIEREAKYFDIACRRIEAALKAPDMFVAPRVVPVKQEGFL